MILLSVHAPQDMVRYLLLVEGAQVNVQDYAGWTPLHEACSSGNMGVAELLLRHGADTNISSTDGTRYVSVHSVGRARLHWFGSSVLPS